jgi:hypothetical protein
MSSCDLPDELEPYLVVDFAGVAVADVEVDASSAPAIVVRTSSYVVR